MYVSVCVRMCKSCMYNFYTEKLCVQGLAHRTCILAQFPRKQRCHEETEGKTLRKEAFCFRRVREEGFGEGVRSQEGPGHSLQVLGS